MNRQSDTSTSSASALKQADHPSVRPLDAVLISETDTSYRHETGDEDAATFEVMTQPAGVPSASINTTLHDKMETPGSSPVSRAYINDNPPPPASDDFHFTIEVPGKPKPQVRENHSAAGDDDIFYLPTIQPERPGEPEAIFEVETCLDLDSGIFSTTSVASGVHSTAEEPLTIDEAIERVVSSKPLLSESELFHLLKGTALRNFKLTRRTLKKQLRINGLENSYQRFRAYLTG